MFIIFGLMVSYLMGSMCSAVILSRLYGLPDPRTEGSNNPGATNVLRLAGKKYAAMVLFADMLKGFIPVFLGKLLGASPFALGCFGLAAVLGHVFPVFFNFKGGKGVATALGAIFGFQFVVGTFITWILIAKFLRYSSLASLVAITLTPLYSIFVIHSLNGFLPLLAIALVVVSKHSSNILRLIEGKEPKIKWDKKTAPEKK